VSARLGLACIAVRAVCRGCSPLSAGVCTCWCMCADGRASACQRRQQSPQQWSQQRSAAHCPSDFGRQTRHFHEVLQVEGHQLLAGVSASRVKYSLHAHGAIHKCMC
jgi:hypothetical protein